MKRCAILLFGVLLISSPAAAEDRHLSKSYASCMEKSGGVTAEMLNCADAELQIQDARLNRAYQALMTQTVAVRKGELRDVQKQWLKFREMNCRFYEDPDRGSSAGIAASSCFLEATAARAKELEALKD